MCFVLAFVVQLHFREICSGMVVTTHNFFNRKIEATKTTPKRRSGKLQEIVCMYSKISKYYE